jgi:hypothetical protein
MIEVNGVTISHFDFTLMKVNDLLFYEGPILSYFTNEYGWDFFMYWCDNDDNFNRWLLFRVDKQQLRDFFLRKETLFQLIKHNSQGFIYIIDIDENIEYTNKKIVSINNIPKNYFPSVHSFYDDFHYEEYSIILKEKVLTTSFRKNQKEIEKLFQYIQLFEKQYNNEKTVENIIIPKQTDFSNYINLDFSNRTTTHLLSLNIAPKGNLVNNKNDNFRIQQLNTYNNVHHFN